MRFGFNVISEDAKEQMKKIGIRYYPKDTMWIVESEAYDSKEMEFQNHQPSYDTRSELTPELKKEYTAQGTRIMKERDTGRYFYLIKDHVFKCTTLHSIDRTFGNPTDIVVTYFDDVSKDQQDSMRDVLINRPPNANSGEGGVLI